MISRFLLSISKVPAVVCIACARTICGPSTMLQICTVLFSDGSRLVDNLGELLRLSELGGQVLWTLSFHGCTTVAPLLVVFEQSVMMMLFAALTSLVLIGSLDVRVGDRVGQA